MSARRLVALVALSVGLVAGGWQALISPGPLSKAHDPWAGDCDECHLTFEGIPDSKCLECHEDLGARIATGRGFHATGTGGKACHECHSDHQGLDAGNTKPAALASFDHQTTGFGLHGKHADIQCATCHDVPLGRMKASCGNCHDDEHEGLLGTECRACHVDQGWNEGLKAIDAHEMAMGGGHEGLLCEECHAQGQHLELDVDCAACHEDAHGGIKSDCSTCHEVTGFKPAKFDHGPCTCAFPGEHQTAACLDCHAGFDFAHTPTSCSGCHTKDRKHESLGECSQCHNALSWSDSQFDHDRAKFKLRDLHLEVSCDMCHATAGQFRDAPTDCLGCHADEDQEAHPEFHSEGGDGIGPCEECHTPAGFTPSSFDHATTGFELSGKHGTLDCAECHPSKTRGL